MGDDHSLTPSISADGRFIAFQSDATNFTDTNVNGIGQIYLFDRDADGDGSFYSEVSSCTPGPATITLVSAAMDGTPGDGRSLQPEISANGDFAIFASPATNLLSGEADQQTNSDADIYVRYIGFETTLQFGAPTQTNGQSIYLPVIRR